MNEFFYTIKEESEGFYEEKSSKFIAKNYYVESEEIVNTILETLRKEYKDARHIVYAYKIGNTVRCSDDGEPQGTGGMPLLRIIESNNLNNILIICIRYFGGILLGVGPLARAYMQATKNLIKSAKIEKVTKAISVTFKVSYSDFEHAKSIILRNNGSIISNNFLENVEIRFKIPVGFLDNCENELKKIDLSIKFYDKEECFI